MAHFEPERKSDQWAISPLGCEFVPAQDCRKSTPTCRRSRYWSRASIPFRPSPTTTSASQSSDNRTWRGGHEIDANDPKPSCRCPHDGFFRLDERFEVASPNRACYVT